MPRIGSVTGQERPLILGIGGTSRADSSTERALSESLRVVQQAGAKTRLLGGDFLSTLPIFDPGPEGPTAEQMELVAAVGEADGVIVASPGYHGAISGVMKNAFDTLELARAGDRPYLSDLPVGIIITAGGWQAGGTALVTLRTIVHALRGWPTPFGATLNSSVSLFDEGGRCCAEKDAAQLATVATQVLDFARMKRRAA
ncbi:NADPH-dependent FMN reductase [Novosphingobium tardum]|uniref:NADPH-dependent FMN reductase n=1 Tax=Novosphingobium tardum TaxID=1538021 RepID=A0ABV8RN03_9SPHN